MGDGTPRDRNATLAEISERKKGGKGLSEGYITELSAFFGVMPGHEEQLDEACRRFAQVMRDLDPVKASSTGLRDSRHTIHDDRTRLVWVTTFETDWDTYIDDALLVVGAEHFIDWMRHTAEAETILAWFRDFGGEEGGLDRGSEGFEENALAASQEIKKIIQSVQTTACAYFNPLSLLTLAEIDRATRIARAFDEVLDAPDAEAALSNPALRPLLDQAQA